MTFNPFEPIEEEKRFNPFEAVDEVKKLSIPEKPVENNWKFPKSFYNGLIAQGGRGMLGALQMHQDNQLREAEKLAAEQNPNAPLKRSEGSNIFRDYANKASWLQDYNVQGDSEIEQFALDLTSGAGQLLRQGTTAALTGGLGAAGVMVGDIAGNQYLDLTNRGIEKETARKAAVGNYAVQAPLEHIGLGKIMNKVPKGTPLKNRFAKYFERFVTEGGTEGLQTLPEQFSEIYAENPNATAKEMAQKWDANRAENLKEMGRSAALGGVLGVGGGAAVDALNGKDYGKVRQLEPKEEKQDEPLQKTEQFNPFEESETEASKTDATQDISEAEEYLSARIGTFDDELTNNASYEALKNDNKEEVVRLAKAAGWGATQDAETIDESDRNVMPENADEIPQSQEINNTGIEKFETLEGLERDAAEYVMQVHPNNPIKGWKTERAKLQKHYEEMLAPIMNQLRSGMKQGVSIIKPPDNDGKGYRVSNNDRWYSDFYAKHKRAPNKRELEQIAREVYSGESNILPGWINDGNPEAEAYFAERKAELDELLEMMDALDAIKEKLPGTFSKANIVETITEEVPKVSEDVNEDNRKLKIQTNKVKQLEIIKNTNPMRDDIHTGIRNIGDIQTAEEAFNVGEDEFMGAPDWTYEDGQKALGKGEVVVYSSYPIETGVFVSPSKQIAQDYAGEGRVYEKKVPLSDVAWIDSIEGQYARQKDVSERDLINEAEELYQTVLENYSDIKNGNEVVKERVQRAIQQTLDFGTEAGEILQGESMGGIDVRQGTLWGSEENGTTKEQKRAKTLGFGITRKLVNDGAFSLVGKQINSVQDLAEYAQILRHPGYEKFHRVYVDKDGKIIGHETVTAMLPHESMVFADNNDLEEHLAKLHNDLDFAKVYYIHNHPSTEVKPSKADMHVTKLLANHNRPGRFGGHIVLDTDKYSLIDGMGDWSTYGIPEDKQVRYDRSGVPHVALGEKLYDDAICAKVIKTLDDMSKTTVFILDTHRTVRAVVQLPDKVSQMQETELTRYLEKQARNYYGRYAVLSTSDKDLYQTAVGLVRKGYLTSIFLTKDRDFKSQRDINDFGVSDQRTFFGKSAELGTAHAKKLLKEDSEEYGNTPVSDIKHSVEEANKNFVEKIELHTKKDADGFNFSEGYTRSPSWIAKKIPKFKLFYEYAVDAMQKQESLRSKYNRILKRIDAKLKADGNYEENKKVYQALLWSGDTEGKEYTRAELEVQGYNDSVISAYLTTRQAIKMTYNLLNDTRKQISTYQKIMSAEELEKLKANKFITILSEDPRDDDYLVAYRSPEMWEKKMRVTQDMLRELKSRDTVQILDVRKPDGSRFENEEDAGNGDVLVKYREVAADIGNRTGYISHFFHEWFIVDKQTDKDGNESYTVLGSARTQNEAVEKAEELLKDNPGRNIVVSPKRFSLDDDENARAAVVGDIEYQTLAAKLAKDMEMTVDEAKEFMKGKIKMRNRHRFFGNFITRKGVEGFEQDLDWVLRHYFNSAARYVALEGFKPKAIGLFERYFGRFDNDYNSRPLANYVKQYINDVNGNPSALETMLNNMLNSSEWCRKHIVSHFGDRVSLQVANSITGKITILKLGFMNFSSAFLNMTQLINTVGLLGDVGDVAAGLADAVKPNMTARKIYAETGVVDDIGMDSTSGYGRFKPGAMAEKTLYMFRKADMLARKTTVLAAYKNGRKKGMGHKEAINYAKDINRKANFDYSIADAPNVFRRGSVIAQLALQFKKYPIKELELMYELARKGSKTQNTKFWGTYFLIAGLLQFPAADMFDELWQELFGDSPRNEIKKMIIKATADSDPLTKKLADIAMYGIGAAANVDLSYRAGLGEVNPAKLPQGLGELLGGPTYSTIKQAVAGLPSLMQGDVLPVVKALSPALGNYVEAAQGYSQGRRARTNSIYETAYEQILKAAGFRSVDESKVYDVERIIKDERSERTDERAAVMDRIISKIEKGKQLDKEDFADMERLRITKKQVNAERAKKRSDRKGRLEAGLSREEKFKYQDLVNSL